MNEFEFLIIFFNIGALWAVLFYVNKKNKRIDITMDLIRDYLDYISDRNDAIYLDMLFRLKERLIQEERYEEIKNIDKCINQELKAIDKKNKK